MIPTVTYFATPVTLTQTSRASVPTQKVPYDRAVSDSQATYLHKLAMGKARRLGLDDDAAEDCAGQFLVFMLTPPRDAELRSAFSRGSVGWLLRCAENWGLNYRRTVVALRSREVNWSSMQRSTGNASGLDRSEWQPATNQGNPEAELLRAELRGRMLAAASHLAEGQRLLFLRCLGDGEFTRLGRGYGRSDGATRNALWRLRRRMRRLLVDEGMSPEEAASYLDILARTR